MQGDISPPTASEGDSTRARKGPRHAAPRKSLLTKLHLPAGKAIALAAMPTAVLMGMGFTPRLALADDGEIPFAPGPCVTRSEEPTATDSGSPKPSPSTSSQPREPAESAKPSATPAPQPSRPSSEPPDDDEETDREDGDGESEGDVSPAAASPSASPGDRHGGHGASRGGPSPSVSPSASRSGNPLDRLDVAAAVKGLIEGIGKPPPTPSAAPSGPTGRPTDPQPGAGQGDGPSGTDGRPGEPPPPDTDGSDENPEPGENSESGQGDESGTSTNDGSDDGSEATPDPVKDAIKKAADQAGAAVKELDEDLKGLDAQPDKDIPEGAKPRFPCPTADPDALAAARLESGIPLLPDDPWELRTSMLTLRGLSYHGIVEVRTADGKVKKVLKFTASSVDIRDLHQLAKYPVDSTMHVKARAGSTSTIRDGTVTMYTESLEGNLFGLIPITFSPRTPPPLDVPFAMFTDATVRQAGQFGGTLTVPGLRNYVERGDG